MRPGLIALGLLLLVIGAGLYVLPGTESRANARETALTSNFATAGIAAILIGVLLGLLGIVIPGARYTRRGPRDVQTVEHITTVRDSDGAVIDQNKNVEYKRRY